MRYNNNDKRSVMRSKTETEVALAWVIVGLVALPLIVLYPGVLGIGILGYALYILYTHYSKP